MRKKFFYTTPVNSETGKAISAFFSVCADAEKQAQEFVHSLGATEYIESPMGMAGGVSYIVNPRHSNNNDLWRPVSLPDIGTCYEINVPESFCPDKAREKGSLSMAENVEMARLALPVVSETQLVSLFDAKTASFGDRVLPIAFHTTPSIFQYQGLWFCSLPFQSQRDDVTEIGEKMFYRRRLAIVNKN